MDVRKPEDGPIIAERLRKLNLSTIHENSKTQQSELLQKFLRSKKNSDFFPGKFVIGKIKSAKLIFGKIFFFF